MEESFGPGNQFGQQPDQNERFDQRRRDRQEDMRRGRSEPDGVRQGSGEIDAPATPNRQSPYRKDWTPKRTSRSNSPEGVKIVDVHPSHRGTTYTRKPKKKKKKMKRAQTDRVKDHDAFFLAPTRDVEVFKYEETPPQSHDGGRANTPEDEAPPFDGQEEEVVAEPPKKKRKPKSTISLDQYIRKKDSNAVNLPDYEGRAIEEMEDDEFSNAGGFGSLADIKYSDGHIYEPEPADYEFCEASQNEGINPLSYKAVKRWQYKMHPRDRRQKYRVNTDGEKFNWLTEDISFLPMSMCQVKRSTWVTPCAREIGLGPTLFIMTHKALLYLFLFFFAVNFPLMFFYAKGSGKPQEDPKFTDLFAKVSLGNLGTSDYTCSSINAARAEKTFSMECNFGTMRYLTEFGLQKRDNQTCTDKNGYFIGEDNKWDDLQYDCTFDSGLTPEGKQALLDTFNEKCYDKGACDLKIMFSWFNSDCRNRIEFYAAGSKFSDYADSLKWHYHIRDFRRREPVLFMNVLCISDQIYNPFSGEQIQSFGKDKFVYFMIIVDFIVVLVSIWFINWLFYRTKQYAEVYDSVNVEMRDFVLCFGNLPNDHVYGGKDMMLQCQLWNHIERIVRNSFEESARQKGDRAALDRMAKECPWEIVDIVFSKSNEDERIMLEEMDALDRKKKTEIFKVQKQTKEGKEEGIDLANEQIVELIKQYRDIKQEYILLQEEKLYTMWEINEVNGRSEGDCTNKFAYVTFRSMKGKNRAEKLFMYAQENSKMYEEENEKQFWDKWLHVSTVMSPSNIQWRNINLSYANRMCRWGCMWLFAIILIVLAFLAMVFFKDWSDALSNSVGSTKPCPEEGVDMTLAYEDYLKPGKQRQGYHHCYCLEVITKNDGSIEGAWVENFKDDPSITENPCAKWQTEYKYSMYMIIITGAMISAINGICVALFEIMVPIFEGCVTYPQESKSQFNRIVIVQYMMIALVLLFADFSLGKVSEGGISILMGKHRDFDTAWYYDVGAKITMAMVSNSIAPYASKLFEPILVPILRWVLDRCFKKHLRKKTNIKEAMKKQYLQYEADRKEERRKKREERKAGKGKVNVDDTPRAAGNDDMGKTPRGEVGEDGEVNSSPQDRQGSASKTGQDDEEEMEGGQRTKKPIKQRRRQEQQRPNDGLQMDGGDELETPNGKGADADGQEYDEEEDQETVGTKNAPKEGVFEYEECGNDECETQMIFQDDLNEFYLNKLMLVFYVYSWYFTNLLVYYTYGGAMPLMWLLGALFWVLGYLCWKFLTICFYRKTYGFDEEIPLYAISLMKYAIFVHLAMIMFMYTDKRILTPPGYDEEIHFRPMNQPLGELWEKRFDTATNNFVLTFCILICVFYCIYKCIVMPICYFVNKSSAAKKAKMEENVDDLHIEGYEEAYAQQVKDDFSDDFYKELNIMYLRDLYIRSKKEYEFFRTMINAMSYDEEKLSDEYCKQFKKNLRMRIQILEDTIDVHLNIIGGLERFMDKTYLYKLAVLELNEELIKENDPRCMRLNEITQSFYIYEQREFQKAKQICNRIDRELLELDNVDYHKPVYC